MWLLRLYLSFWRTYGGKRNAHTAGFVFLLYIVFNSGMGSFPCFWSSSHYLCKWELCVIIKCSRKMQMNGTNRATSLGSSQWTSQAKKWFRGNKGNSPHCDSRRAFNFFSQWNIMNWFTLFYTVWAFDIHALVKNKTDHAVLLTEHICECDYII